MINHQGEEGKGGRGGGFPPPTPSPSAPPGRSAGAGGASRGARRHARGGGAWARGVGGAGVAPASGKIACGAASRPGAETAGLSLGRWRRRGPCSASIT